MIQDHNTLILEIYNTVGDDRRWNTVLQHVADELGAAGGVIFDAEWRGDSARLTTPYFSAGYEDALVAQYIDRFHDEEFAVQKERAAQLSQNDAVEIYLEDLTRGAHDPLRKPDTVTWLASLGVYHTAACFLMKDDPSRSRFSLQFTSRDEDGDRLSRLHGLVPHIAKAMELGRPAAQLARRHQNVLHAMNRLRVGMCILDQRGRSILANDEFERQSQDYGVFRVGKDGRLHMREPEDQRRLSEFTGRLDMHGRFGARPRREAIVAAGPANAPPLCIEVTPLARHDEIGSTPVDGAILYSLDTSRPLPVNLTAIASAFSLTAAETGLINLVSEGLTNAEIADRRGRSIETINAQVKSILAKTSCANRTQFVRLISSFAPATVD